MKKISKMNWFNIDQTFCFLLYLIHFTWKANIKKMTLTHNFIYLWFMSLISLRFLKKEESDLSQNSPAEFLSFDTTMTLQVPYALEKIRLFRHLQKIGYACSQLANLMYTRLSKIQIAVKDFLKIEPSLLISVGDKKTILW